jgi:hypothetical protein
VGLARELVQEIKHGSVHLGGWLSVFEVFVGPKVRLMLLTLRPNIEDLGPSLQHHRKEAHSSRPIRSLAPDSVIVVVNDDGAQRLRERAGRRRVTRAGPRPLSKPSPKSPNSTLLCLCSLPLITCQSPPPNRFAPQARPPPLHLRRRRRRPGRSRAGRSPTRECPPRPPPSSTTAVRPPPSPPLRPLVSLPPPHGSISTRARAAEAGGAVRDSGG